MSTNNKKQTFRPTPKNKVSIPVYATALGISKNALINLALKKLFADKTITAHIKQDA